MHNAKDKKSTRFIHTFRLTLATAAIVIAGCIGLTLSSNASASAQSIVAPAPQTVAAGYWCGAGKYAQQTTINFGCTGTTCKNSGTSNTKFCQKDRTAVADILFAILRFLTAGVGIVVVGSVIVGGIQYAASRGEPQKAAEAMKRITNSLIALGIYIFAFAFVNFLIPTGFFAT
jgi:type IV secretion system pilin